MVRSQSRGGANRFQHLVELTAQRYRFNREAEAASVELLGRDRTGAWRNAAREDALDGTGNERHGGSSFPWVDAHERTGPGGRSCTERYANTCGAHGFGALGTTRAFCGRYRLTSIKKQPCGPR